VKNDRNLTLKILFVCLAVVLVLYFTLNKQTKRHQWIESYKTDSDEPYGTMFIRKLLSDFRPGQKFTLNDKTPLHILLDSAKPAPRTDYVFIGQELFLNKEDQVALLNFIHSGNDAFIASVNLPFDVIDPLFISECDREIFLVKDDTITVTLNFYNTNLKTDLGYTYAYRFGAGDRPYFWDTLNPEIFCDSTKSIMPLGYVHPDKVNFFKLSYGEGNLYVHSNPLVFTNYFLTKADKADYASAVFSHLRGESIIWDEFSRSKFIPQNNAPGVSPVMYILQQESLRYAWWLLLAGALLYVMFTAKRKQRIIRVLEGKANTSLEFVNMMAALHFQNGNHHDMARKKMKYFFYFIRARYGMHIQELAEAHMIRLAEKSKLELQILKAIAVEFDHVQRLSFYNEPRLIDLQIALETFYKQCK
jgi:hypothetical protein